MLQFGHQQLTILQPFQLQLGLLWLLLEQQQLVHLIQIKQVIVVLTVPQLLHQVQFLRQQAIQQEQVQQLLKAKVPQQQPLITKLTQQVHYLNHQSIA